MPRVYRVTFTKTFDVAVLADSEEALREALHGDDIDNNWDVPNDWTIDIADPMRTKLPVTLPKYDAAVVGNTIYATDDEGVEDIRQRAEDELTKRWMAEKQIPLPFEKP